jgi:DNA-directed RNA polymerase subunit RPC12/RpoP
MAKIVSPDMSLYLYVGCAGCAQTVQYTRGEVRDKKHSYDYTGGYEVNGFINCPNCGHSILVKQRELTR